MTDSLSLLSTRQRVALAAAVGAGVVVGAGGIVVYQRLNQNVSLSVTGRDFTQELTTLSHSIERLRMDIENLRGNITPPKEGRHEPAPVLRSALKKQSSYTAAAASFDGDTDVEGDGGTGPPFATTRHVRTLSNCSSYTNGSSSGTEYFSALSDDEDFRSDENTGFRSLSYEEEESLSVLARVDDLMDGKEEQQREALQVLLEQRAALGDSPAYLWRLCKAQYLLGVLAGQAGDIEEKKELIMTSVETGEAALRADDKNSEAHKWYAIALGSRGEFGGIREKILDGFEFKKHIDSAAALNPSDHIIHHLLGRFCYEVSQLSWLERKMAGTLFAEPPSATLQEALDHFLAAEQMKPDGWKENRLFIAKCHIGMGDYVSAMTWLDRADSIPLAAPDVREGIKDRLSQEEVDQLMAKYHKYRV